MKTMNEMTVTYRQLWNRSKSCQNYFHQSTSIIGGGFIGTGIVIQEQIFLLIKYSPKRHRTNTLGVNILIGGLYSSGRSTSYASVDIIYLVCKLIYHLLIWLIFHSDFSRNTRSIYTSFKSKFSVYLALFNYNLQMSSVKATLKSSIIAIAYSAAVKQILKICKTNEQANSKLFQLGEQIGMRVADEYQQRQTNSYKPEEVTTVFLKGILKQYMGCDALILDKQIKYLKNRFVITFKVILKENPLADFVILSKNQKQDERGPLNYHSIILGFVNGCMRSMSYNPTVKLISDSLINENQGDMSPNVQGRNETAFLVDMWKEKEED